MKNLKNYSKTTFALLTILFLFTATNALAQSAKVVEMKGTDQLRFSVESIQATPGQKITVKLTN